MFYDIEIPECVENDIAQLSDYIYRFSFSKEISKQVYNELYKTIFSLEFLPYRFEIYAWDYRRVIVKWSYKIFYRIDEHNKKVIIIRVLRTEQIEDII